ncbi:cyclic nucleotide-binding domain-containing protein [Desulfofundulus thermobenzoicus]|uniref:Cyclic nucleotide-binding domain-containing protein n=1 Tax=Desulfofundulus thermobenzoicus TaxID=29376 RepID=A0A6N7IPI1_9FIRM|nr:Crp/Fnr family transcriptional regulator [Desulfofundulus thermobenzoicus]MQL51870.1 cyclic nucleotide-binding domain-containing protein [Desulfofundulus thermobenzoicus]
MALKHCICLKDIPLFASVTPSSFHPICQAATKRYMRRGEILFHQGDKVDAVYLVKEGSFKMVRLTEEGQEVILQIASQGEIIGEAALFQEQCHPATAIALEDAKICHINRRLLEEIIKKTPDLAWQVIASLGSRLYATWEQMTELNTLTTREKVLSLLVRLAREHGEVCPEGTRIRFHLTQQEIASMVGASRVMVAQALKELITSNYLCREEKYYVLRDRCF